MPDLVFIGTGDAFGSGGRRNSAILVRGRRGTLLLDCGPTTLGGLKALGVDPREIDAIAISHYHGDHIGGIPFLLIDYLYESEREKPLRIIGPPAIAERVERLMSVFEYDGEKAPSYAIEYSEFRAGRPLSVLDFRLEPIPAFHHPSTEPFMLRITDADRQIFFTGDTGWHESLPEHVGEADLFISECVNLEEVFEFHLAHERLDAERKRFRAARTILTHLGSEVLENPGKIRFDLAQDGMRLRV